MNARRQDFELLQSFVRQGEQTAFAEIVRRHIELVFATALRKLEDPAAAQEVAQNVFIALSRKAWRFAPDDSLPAWLHKTTLLESKSWLRGELRRQRREEMAAQLGTTMKATNDQPALDALVPLLDEALLSLRETDRTALLLRYYENRSLREVGEQFGVCEDAAQKRVQRALEKLTRFFHQHGFKTATLAVSAAVLKATGATVPAATASVVANAALQAAPPTLTVVAAMLARIAALSKIQTAALCIAVGIGPVAWQWNQTAKAKSELSAVQSQAITLRTDQEKSDAELKQLRLQLSRIEGSRAATSAQAARGEAAARKLEEFRARARAMLTDYKYHWPDDLPFTRIPKSALPSVIMAGGPNTPDKFKVKVDLFLDLTPVEREAADRAFSKYYAAIDQLLAKGLYETNRATTFDLPAGAQSRVFVLQPLGPGIRSALDQLDTDLIAAFGQDRWESVKPDKFEITHYEQVRVLGYTQFAWDKLWEISVNVFPGTDGEPTVSLADNMGMNNMSPQPLRGLLHGPTLFQGPLPLTEKVNQCLADETAARLTNP